MVLWYEVYGWQLNVYPLSTTRLFRMLLETYRLCLRSIIDARSGGGAVCLSDT
jgi:hypothetical protein